MTLVLTGAPASGVDSVHLQGEVPGLRRHRRVLSAADAHAHRRAAASRRRGAAGGPARAAAIALAGAGGRRRRRRARRRRCRCRRSRPSRLEAIANSPTELLVRLTPAPGLLPVSRQDLASACVDGEGVALGAPRCPPAKPYHDEHFGDVQVWFDQAEIPVPVLRSDTARAQTITLEANFQGCLTDGICYPPMTRTAGGRTCRRGASAGSGSAASAASAATPPGAAATRGLLLGAAARAARRPDPQPDALRAAGAVVQGARPGAGQRQPRARPRARALVHRRRAGQLRARRRAGARPARRRPGAGLGLPAAAALAGRRAGAADVRDRPEPVGRGPVRRLAGRRRPVAGREVRRGRRLLHRRAGGGGGQPLHRAVHGRRARLRLRRADARRRCWCSSTLGLGLALPFLLIGFVPALAARLPQARARGWRRSSSGWPSRCTSPRCGWPGCSASSAASTRSACCWSAAVLLALALWWCERRRFRGGRVGALLPGFALALAIAALVLGAAPAGAGARAPRRGAGRRPRALLRAGAGAVPRAKAAPVFIDMTADWCITCKVNEKAVLDTAEFRRCWRHQHRLHGRRLDQPGPGDQRLPRPVQLAGRAAVRGVSRPAAARPAPAAVAHAGADARATRRARRADAGRSAAGRGGAARRRCWAWWRAWLRSARPVLAARRRTAAGRAGPAPAAARSANRSPPFRLPDLAGRRSRAAAARAARC